MGNLIRMNSKMHASNSLESEKLLQSVWTIESEQTLGLISTLKKEQYPVCPLHKRRIDCICLFEQCEEIERFTCHACRKKAHLNHDQMSLQQFKDDLLDYISFRRNERRQQANPSGSKNNQTSHILITSLIKQFQRSRVLTEQFILEGLANDIESLIRKLNELQRDQRKSLEARKELVEFHQTFSQLIKQFIQRKNLTEARSFWIQHDLANDIHSFSPGSTNSSKTNCPLSLKRHTPKQLSRPYFSLSRFFENYSHKMNYRLAGRRISFCCQVVYLNENYCLIPFAQGFQVDSVAIYDMRLSKIVKEQRIELYKHLLSNNIVFRMDFNHIFENEFLEVRPNLEIFDRLEIIMNQYMLFQPLHLLNEEEDELEWIRNQSETIDFVNLGEDLPSPIIRNEQIREQTQFDRINQQVERNIRNIELDQENDPNQFNEYDFSLGWDNINNNLEEQAPIDFRRPTSKFLEEENEIAQVNNEPTKNETLEASNKASLNQDRFNSNNDQEVKSSKELEEDSKLEQSFEEIITEKECLNSQNSKNLHSKQTKKLRSFDNSSEEEGQKKDYLEESKDIFGGQLNQQLLEDKAKNEESNEISNKWLSQDTFIDQMTEMNPIMQSEKEDNSEQESQNNQEESNDNYQIQSEDIFDRVASNRQSSLHNSNSIIQSQQPLFSANPSLEGQVIQNNRESETQNGFQDLNEGFILSQTREEAESTTNQPIVPNWLDEEGDNEAEQRPFLYNSIGSNLMRRPFLVRVNDRSVAEVENQTNIIIYKVNLSQTQSDKPLLKKERTIQTLFPVKSIFMVSESVMCLCSKMSLLFSDESQVSFVNTSNGKTIKTLTNIGFCGELIGKLELSEERQMILYFRSINVAYIYDWRTQQEVRRYDMHITISFENMRIFIQFFYHMYRSFDFNVEKIAMQLKDKVLQYTNFQENSLQYCLPYYSISAKDKKGTVGICYLQDKNLKFVPFSLKKINITSGIAQMFISNDQLVIILKNGQVHHCSIRSSILQPIAF